MKSVNREKCRRYVTFEHVRASKLLAIDGGFFTSSWSIMDKAS